MRELARGELGVGGKAHYGGAYDRTRVRTRVNAGAWQGLQRQQKAHAILTPTLISFRKRVKKGGRGGSSRLGICTGQVEQQDQSIFFCRSWPNCGLVSSSWTS